VPRVARANGTDPERRDHRGTAGKFSPMSTRTARTNQTAKPTTIIPTAMPAPA
jgi:hypothetical protein